MANQSLDSTTIIHLLICFLSGLKTVIIEYTDMLKMVITSPLRFVYLHGPSINGFGFWNGVPSSQICAQLTKVESDHWKQHSVPCDTLIERQIDAFIVTMLLILGVGLFVKWIGTSIGRSIFKVTNKDNRV
uniref:Uncharacterized protein n=1 Tax=Clandestinovirus TaxID=2831644 RepID=A0A8F8KLE3_9VIRU|nr:hypothetical protein KOM_12_585 [Clandestinovirus]